MIISLSLHTLYLCTQYLMKTALAVSTEYIATVCLAKKFVRLSSGLKTFKQKDKFVVKFINQHLIKLCQVFQTSGDETTRRQTDSLSLIS